MKQDHLAANTGLPGLDEILQGVRLGDNVVFRSTALMIMRVSRIRSAKVPLKPRKTLFIFVSRSMLLSFLLGLTRMFMS